METQKLEKDNILTEATLTPIGVKNATIVIAMIPVMLVYPFAQKYFVKGAMNWCSERVGFREVTIICLTRNE